MGSFEEKSYLQQFRHLMAQDYRGVNIAVYAVATTGLAIAIHRIRPVSKFSNATQIPAHFYVEQQPLSGVYAGVSHSPVRLLVNHRAPIYLPLWHSSKPPLPVKLWGVDIVSGNAVNWLQCVASGKRVTLRTLARDNDSLVSTVMLHLPKHKSKEAETLDIGQKLIELGFAKASVPAQIKKNSIESKIAPALLSAEARAKNYRIGVWSERLPPLPFYIIYWRKTSKTAGELAGVAARNSLYLLGVGARNGIYLLGSATKGTLIGLKNLAFRPFRKSVQTA